MVQHFLRILCNPSYLESWYIQNLRNIQNPVKHLLYNVFLMNPGIYTMKYFIQNPMQM